MNGRTVYVDHLERNSDGSTLTAIKPLRPPVPVQRPKDPNRRLWQTIDYVGGKLFGSGYPFIRLVDEALLFPWGARRH
jgi:hypothetical protein